MEDRLDTIVRLNIEHFKKLLETDIDETKRQMVKRLLAEEHANLVEAISKAILREAEKDRDQTEKEPDQRSAVNG
jgi:hypothetical protein